MEPRKINLVAVLGHTAAGKTEFAAHLAGRTGGEIISADSRQVYRGMDIGTGKDYADYLVEGKTIPVHLIDIMDPGFEYNLYLYKLDFLRVFTDITDRAKLPLLCGGSGLYLEAVLRNYQMLRVPLNRELRESMKSKSLKELEGILKLYGPLHNVTDTVNRKRIIRAIEIAMYQSSLPEEPQVEEVLRPLVFGIRYERNLRRERITERLKKRLDQGMVEEVQGLMALGVTAEKMDYYGLEYRYVSKFILNELSYEEMFLKLNTAIHQFAKRQMTYFRGMERRGIKIHWLEGRWLLGEKLERAVEQIREAEMEQ